MAYTNSHFLYPSQSCPLDIEHCPLAEPNTHFLMIEPASTAHPGSLNSEAKVAFEDQHWI
ncbi:hypothetical protein [uncultured Psychrobacter sp.]|uniref:hypothetical protein n=1 Tax=uncultured Psychrobacter sp. TaxID=259303 RepID=UPI003457A19E